MGIDGFHLLGRGVEWVLFLLKIGRLDNKNMGWYSEKRLWGSTISA